LGYSYSKKREKAIEAESLDLHNTKSDNAECWMQLLYKQVYMFTATQANLQTLLNLRGLQASLDMRRGMRSRRVRRHDLPQDCASRHRDATVQNDGAGQQSESASLMCRCQPRRDHVNQCADTKRDLDGNEVHDTQNTLLRILRDPGAHALGEAGVGPERHDGGEGGRRQHAVVQLHERRVLEHVAPPEVRLVRHMAVEGVKQLLLGRGQAKAHPGKFIVDEASIETRDERTRHGGGEDQEHETGHRTAEETQSRVLQRANLLGGFGRVGQHAMFLENGQAGVDHGAVDGKRRAEMGREPILADTRVAAGIEQVVLEPAFHHPPANDALEANHTADAGELEGHGRCDAATGDEVGGRQEEGDADDAPPQTMRPLHKVDLLELGQRHARVELGKFRRRAVLVELALPGFWAARPQGARDRAPFGDTQSGRVSRAHTLHPSHLP
jgi:hypothetical protein